MERIIQEKISADHLLYVSLKYTKTTDVMINLIARWRSMIEASSEKILEHLKKKKIISSIPDAPKVKMDKLKEVYKKNEAIISTLVLYDFFKKIERMEKVRENEFRKNVALKVLDGGGWKIIDIEKLKEYNALLERFISTLKQIL